MTLTEFTDDGDAICPACLEDDCNACIGAQCDHLCWWLDDDPTD